MTLEEIRQASKVFLTPTEISGVLHCDPHSIRVAAKDCPERLGFPVTRIGTRTLIPRVQFLNYVEGNVGTEGRSL